MRLMLSELHKVWGHSVFVLCLVVLAGANLFLLYIGTKPGENSASAEAYRLISSDLKNLDTKEQQAFIDAKYDLVYGLLQVESLLQQCAYSGEWAKQIKEDHADIFDQYEAMYRNKEYELYTDNLHTEYKLLSQIKAEVYTVAAYPEFLEEVQTKADQLSNISIFQNSESGYNRKNIDKIAHIYADMDDVQIHYAPQKGLFTALDYQFTDLILIAAMLLLASVLVRQERDSGMLNVIRSAPGGRLKTAAAKLMALAISILIVLILMYGVNLIYCGFTFGLGPLSRSIQSVPALMRCTMQITVWEYLGRFLLAKWAGTFVMGLWVMLAMLWAKRIFLGWLGALMLPLVQWLIRMAIPATSNLNVIKYANLVSLMRTNELLGNYRNLYWFDSPISLPLVEWTAAVFYGALLLIAFCTLFCRGQLLKASVFSGFIRKTDKTKSTTVFCQESKKLYLLGGAFITLIVFAGYQVITTIHTESFINAEGIYYAHYMKQLEGPYNKNTITLLKKMNEEFGPVYELQKQAYDGTISDDYYQMQMSTYSLLVGKMNVFQDIVAHNLYYIQEHPGAQLVYERGWEKLFDFRNREDLQDVLWAGLLSCICFSGLFAFEKKGGMHRVVMATPLGRRYTVSRKLLTSSIAAACICALTYLPRLSIVLRDYWLSKPFAPAMSIQEFENINSMIPIVGIMLWGILGRVVACMTMMMLLLWLSDRLGNTLSAMFVGSVALCLPPLLALSGLDALRWVSFYPLFHLAEMAQRIPDSVAGILCILISISCVWLFAQNLYDRWSGQ